MICIIPARGGSKRITRKNIRQFCGRPMIEWSIRAALASGVFDEVMVSTDDADIADIARACGASVPFMRSEATANDFATTADVLNEVLDRYEAMGRRFDTLCCLYATAPFVTGARLRDAAAILRRGEALGAFTVVRYSYPIQRCLVTDDAGHIGMLFPEYATTRTQDLQPTYHDAGQFYFADVNSFRRHNTLWGPDTVPVILPEAEVQDIDTLEDWEIAEQKFARLHFPDRIHLDGYTLTNYSLVDEAVSTALYNERNNPAVRPLMDNPEPIARASHDAFVRSLAFRDDCVYYAVTDAEGKLVGSVNLHRPVGGEGNPTADRNSLERGILIFEAARGRGIATDLLRKLYAWLAANMSVSAITTHVHPDNAPSHALERALGAQEVTPGAYLFDFDKSKVLGFRF